MAEQALLAELGCRIGVVGSSASLAIAAPISNTTGAWDPSAMTAANRTGIYFDQTGAAEKLAFVVGGQTGPIFTRSGSAVNMAVTGTIAGTSTITAKSGSLVGIALLPQGGAANFTGSITTVLLSANRTYTFPDADVTIGSGGGTIGGSIAATQIAVGSGADTISGSAAFTYTTSPWTAAKLSNSDAVVVRYEAYNTNSAAAAQFLVGNDTSLHTAGIAIGGTAQAGSISGIAIADLAFMFTGRSKLMLFTGNIGSTGEIYIVPSEVLAATFLSTSITFVPELFTAASATGAAGLNLPHGTAPSSPINGDLWTTTAGLFGRINGSTVAYGAGGGTIGGSIANTQVAIGSGANTISGSADYTYVAATGTLTLTTAQAQTNILFYNTVNNGLTQVAAISDTAKVFHFSQYNSAYPGTAAPGVNLADIAWVRANGGHMILSTESALPIYIAPNRTVLATFATTGMTLSTPLVVGSGGTGASSFTSTAVLLGNSTSAILAASGFTYDSTNKRVTIANTSSSGACDILQTDDLGNYVQVAKYGSAFGGNIGSTGVAYAGAVVIGSNVGNMMFFLGSNTPVFYFAMAPQAPIVTIASTGMTLSTPLVVGSGGTGLNSITTNRIPYGNGSSALQTSAGLTYNGLSMLITGTNAGSNIAVDVQNLSATGAAYLAADNDGNKYAEMAIFGSTFGGYIDTGNLVSRNNVALFGGNTPIALGTDTSTSIYIIAQTLVATFTTGLAKVSGNLQVTGGISPPYVTSSGSLGLTVANRTVVYTGSGGHTYTLPAANANGAGQSIWLTIKCSPAASGNLIVARAGSDTINNSTTGNTSITLTPGQSIDINADGVSLWEVT